MAIVAGPDAMTNGDTPAPPMGEAHVCNSPVALSAEPKPKNRTSINIFANFAFDLIPKFACEGAGRIAAKRRIDTLGNAELTAAINCNCGFVRCRLWRPVRACAFRGAEVARNLGFGSSR